MTRCFPSPQQLNNDVLCINVPDEVLENLYARLEVVDKLIRSLEDYEHARPNRGGKCVSFSEAMK